MKITRRQLKQIIKEEILRALNEQTSSQRITQVERPLPDSAKPARITQAERPITDTARAQTPRPTATPRTTTGSRLGSALRTGARGVTRALGPAGLALTAADLGLAAAARHMSPGSYSQGEDVRPITTDTPQDPGTETNIGRRAADPAPVHTATGVGMLEPHEREAIAAARREEARPRGIGTPRGAQTVD